MLGILLRSTLCVSTALLVAAAVNSDDISTRARKLHCSSIVVDTHDDTTQRFLDAKFDIGARHADGSIDVPRMRAGGLGAIFFSVWIPSKVTGPDAVNRALTQIEAVREQVRAHPKDLALATTAAEVRTVHKQGKIAALKSAMQGTDTSAMRRASEELQRSLSHIGESIYGAPAGAGVGGEGPQGPQGPTQQPPDGTVEGEFREV